MKFTLQHIVPARLMRPLATLLVAGTLLMSVACYGSFPLTRTIYKINGNVTNNKLIHTIVFWIFVIFPVYWVGMLVDAIILNLVEFWSGENVQLSSTVAEDGTRITLAPTDDPQVATLTVESPDGTRQVTTFQRLAPGHLEVMNEEGVVVGKILRADDGGMLLCDAAGQTVQTVAASDLQSLALAGQFAAH